MKQQFRYGLALDQSTNKKFYHLMKYRFEKGVKAIEVLQHCRAYQKSYFLLCENYVELEMSMLEVASRNMVFIRSNSEDMRNDRLEITRRLLNFMTTARSYVDQTKTKMPKIFGRNSNEAQKVNSEFSKYEGFYNSYSFLENLRNYSQHNSMPIHSVRAYP